MKDGLLSIGEMARLKGAGIKALRYYERIGILTPAYVNPQTGYRYYSLRQAAEVDVIISCVELGIPLAELASYRLADGSFDMAALLERGERIAHERLARAQRVLKQVESYREGTGGEAAGNQESGNQGAPGTRHLGGRHFLTNPWELAGFDARRYVHDSTALFSQAVELGLTPLFFVGFIWGPQAHGGQLSLGVEVACLGDGPVPRAAQSRIFTVPGDEYRIQRFAGASYEACFADAFEAAARRSPASPVFAFEVWEGRMRSDRIVVELLHA